MDVNQQRFDTLLKQVHNNENGKYQLTDKNDKYVMAVYDTDYETDNGLDEDEEGYEEYHCIAFKRVDNGELFEVDYHNIPVRVLCDGISVY